MYKLSVEDTNFRSNNIIRVKDKLLDLSQPKVMGIINCTPDSFYSESQNILLKNSILKAENLIKEGVDIIDIGGYSSRPGAKDISIQEEIDRVLPLIEYLKSNHDCIISLDTFRSQVALAGLKNGIDIINDISGFEIDPEIINIVAKYNVPYILMHMKGTPQTMQHDTTYDNLFKEVYNYFSTKINTLHQNNINDIIIDLGFGFAKTLEQNYFLLSKLELFKNLKTPILTGISRKSMIYKHLNITPEEALNGTTVLNTVALLKGTNILRVHDVKEAFETVKLIKQLNNVII